MEKKISTASQEFKRNKVERRRQDKIDDEIQKLMCFLPQRNEEKMSRTQILQELYGVALEKMKEEHVEPANQSTEPSTSN